MARSRDTVEQQPPHGELVAIDELRKRVTGLHQESALMAMAEGLGHTVWRDWAGRPAVHVDVAAELVKVTADGERRKQLTQSLFDAAVEEWEAERHQIFDAAYRRQFAVESRAEYEQITSDGRSGVIGTYHGSPRAQYRAREFASDQLAGWMRKNPKPTREEAAREAAKY